MTLPSQSQRRKLIAGNWKMNGLRRSGEDLAEALANYVRDRQPACDVVICPPATILMAVGRYIAETSIGLGAQDCHAKSSGAHTGEISAAMLKDLGCGSVILGHSERRTDHGETDALVRDKAAAALAAGLVPIICVGETEQERKSGRAVEIVDRQIAGSIPDTTADTLVIAYEPVWAIGTGLVPTNAEIVEIHAAIRNRLAGQIQNGETIRILYGGSVKPSNAREVLHLNGVDGALVGGASLKAEEFEAIIDAAT